MKQLLSHIRVLDLSRVLAGPWSAQMLADLGAEVIKVERPGPGDDTRAWGPPFLKTPTGGSTQESGYYLGANRGKRSITVDISQPQGQEIIRELAAKVDIVLENYKVGTLKRYGLDYESLRAINPKLIYCSITGFGQTGPRAEQPAYDFLIQAMGGLMSVTGERDDLPGGGPQKIGIPLIDLITGTYASVGMLAALANREVTGEGEYIDMAMLDVQVSLLSNQAMNYLMSGKTPVRRGNAHPNIQPQDVFKCADGDLVLVVGNDGQFAKLCQTLGAPDLANDPRFDTNPNRVRHQNELRPLLDALFAAKTRAEWSDLLGQAQVPCGPINSIPEALADPQIVHRQMLRQLPHPTAGTVPQLVTPFRFGQAEIRTDQAPPLLGQHTDEVLGELGLSAERIQQLRQDAII
ncbi:MAG: CoA transferase [Limnohabitans sp.]|nr:CoA transferase [Limnohabitans sp.]